MNLKISTLLLSSIAYLHSNAVMSAGLSTENTPNECKVVATSVPHTACKDPESYLHSLNTCEPYAREFVMQVCTARNSPSPAKKTPSECRKVLRKISTSDCRDPESYFRSLGTCAPYADKAFISESCAAMNVPISIGNMPITAGQTASDNPSRQSTATATATHEWVSPGEYLFGSCGNVTGSMVPSVLVKNSKYFSKPSCRTAYVPAWDICLQHAQQIEHALKGHGTFAQCSGWLQGEVSKCRKFVQLAAQECNKLAD